MDTEVPTPVRQALMCCGMLEHVVTSALFSATVMKRIVDSPCEDLEQELSPVRLLWAVDVEMIHFRTEETTKGCCCAHEH